MFGVFCATIGGCTIPAVPKACGLMANGTSRALWGKTMQLIAAKHLSEAYLTHLVENNFNFGSSSLNMYCLLQNVSCNGIFSSGDARGMDVSRRWIQYHAPRRVVGHQVEIMKGKHRRRRALPPKVPVHPNSMAAEAAARRAVPGAIVPAAVQQDMSLFETYRDLKLKWKRTSRQSKKKFVIARKWRQHHHILPAPEPKWALYLHHQMCQKRSDSNANISQAGRKRRSRWDHGLTDEQISDRSPEDSQLIKDDKNSDDLIQLDNKMQNANKSGTDRSARGDFTDNNNKAFGYGSSFIRFEGKHSDPLPDLPEVNKEDLFCIFKSSVSCQHKVTLGDLVQAEKLHRRRAGEQVVFGSVMLVGSPSFTIIGKPTLPFARVHATIEQQTLTGDSISFRYKKTRRASKFVRVRHWVTMLRITDIEFRQEYIQENTNIRPSCLLDLWANRWLDPHELKAFPVVDGKPAFEEIYDGEEHQPGTYHRRGLNESYRWHPDPKATHWRR